MAKTLKVILFVLIGIALLLGGFAGGFVSGHTLQLKDGNQPVLSGAVPVSTPGGAQATTPEDLQTLFQPFWEAWQIVHEQFVDRPVDDTKLMQGAIRGMMDALGDKQTFYMDPETYTTETSALAGQYEGIGAYVDTDGEFLTIISPIPGSPAETAGLRAGDQIIALDGQDVTGVDPKEVRLKVLGPAGTQVQLTIRRAGEAQPLEFTITRAKIDVHSVEGKMLDNGIAYIQISTFGDHTSQELKSTLQTLLDKKPKGIILDLRNNGGGYLQTSIEVASQFLPGDQVALIEQYGDGQRKIYKTLDGGLATDVPMVVLINKGSASASEILAGAIQDYGRGKLIGEISYGKGSVQQWVPLSNQQGAARVTIARWLTPKERQIDGVGLTPDVAVELTEDDFKAGKDPQLDKAIEVLLALIGQ
jgi:carboxyl-terminal processing protease